MDFRREYLVRVPLPLAQLYSRAYNAKDPRSRHDNVFYLFEAFTKLACVPAVACYSSEVSSGRQPHVQAIDRLLLQLALPSFGQWVGIVRELARHFGERPDAATHPLGHLWSQIHQQRADKPGMLNLYRRLKNGPDGALAGDRTCSILDVLNSLVQYRNGVFGHGGPRFESFYTQEMGPLLFPAANEIIDEGMFEFLGPRGSRLVYLTELRTVDEDRVEVGLRELVGLEGERMAPLMLSRQEAENLLPNRVAVLWPGRPVPLRFDPLLIYRESETAQEVLFLNRDRNARQVEYLSYTTGRTEREPTTAPELCRLLSLFAKREIGEEDLRKFSEQSFAESPSAELVLGSAESVGRTLGDFEILAQIGRGGMGIVYLARQLSLGRLVALKMLPADLSGDTVALARFRREIQTLARCEHPHIIKILSSGTFADGQMYYSMEYVPGCDLEHLWRELAIDADPAQTAALSSSTWARAVLSASAKQRATLRSSDSQTEVPEIKRLPLPPLPDLAPADDEPGGYARRVVALVRDAAMAVQAVHDQHIVHRDIKPANLMLTPDGSRVVLMDFGLAKGQTNGLSASRDGGLLGTLRYAAPEQLASANVKVGPPADVRALGVTLWELLTRKRLFAEASDEPRLMQEVLTSDVPRLRSQDPSMDRDLEAIVARATERRVADRIPSAERLAEYLQLFLDGHNLPIRPPSGGELLYRWFRERRGLVAAGASALLAICITIAVAFVLTNAAKLRAIDLAKQNADLAKKETEQRGLADARAEESRRRLVRMNVANGVRLMDARQYFDSLSWFAEALNLDRDRAERELARLRIGAVLREAAKPVQVFQARGAVSRLQISPDGKRIAAGVGDHAEVWDVATGIRVPALLQHAGSVFHTAFSPYGQRILTCSRDGTARVWDTADGHPVSPPLLHDNWVVYGAFSPDGRRVLTCTTNFKLPTAAVRVFNTETGAPISPPMVQGTWVKHASFSPDGDRVASASSNGTAQIWDAVSGKPLGPALNHDNSVISVEWSPDGQRIVTSTESGKHRVWNASNGQLITGPLASSFKGEAVFSRDGKRILVKGSGFRLDVFDAASGVLEQSGIENSGLTRDDRLSPDGRFSCTAHGEMVWLQDRAATTAPQQLFSPAEKAAESGVAAVSSDVGLILVKAAPNKFRIWNVKAGKYVGDKPIDDVAGAHLEFSDDHRSLVTLVDRHTARVWETANGSPIGKPLDHGSLIFRACLSRDGSHVATCGLDGTRIWETQTGNVVAILPDSNGHTMACFSRDGRWIATAGYDQSGRVWDALRGTPLSPPLRHDHFVNSAAFNSDGTKLVTASSDRTARIWDAKSGLELTPPLRHDSPVQIAAFSPDDRLILTGTEQAARVWNATSGKPLTPPLQHRGLIADACFSRDSDVAATIGDDGTLRLWNLAANGDPLGPFLRTGSQGLRVLFGHDLGEVYSVSDEGVQRWNFTSASHSANEILALSRVLSGNRIDPLRGVMPLSADDLTAAWQQVRRDFAAEFSCSSEQLRAWHIRAARTAEASSLWYETLPHLQFLDKQPASRPAETALLQEWLGRTLLHLRKLDQSVSRYTRAISLKPDDWEALSGRGIALFQLGLLDNALADFSKGIEVGGGSDALLWAHRGTVYWLLGDAANSTADLDQSSKRNGGSLKETMPKILAELTVGIEQRPDDWHAWFYRGKADMLTKSWADAVSDLSRALAINKSSFELFEARAESYRNQKKTVEADRDYAEAIALRPDRWELHSERAELQSTAEAWEPALTHLNAALRLKTDDPTLWERRSFVQIKLQHLVEARNDALAAVKLNGKSRRAWQLLAAAELDRKDYRAALKAYDWLVTDDPQSGFWRYWRGKTRWEAKLNEEALADFHKSAELDPKDTSAWHMLGVMHVESGKCEEAVKEFGTAIDLNSTDPLDWGGRGAALAGLGRRLPAQEDLDAALSKKGERVKIYNWVVTACTKRLEQSGDNAAVWWERAEAQTALSAPEKALADYNQALERAPKEWELYYRRGLCFEALTPADNRNALADLNKAIELAPTKWTVWLERGVCHAHLSQWNSAVADYTKAQELSPREYDPWRLRGHSYYTTKRWQDAISDYTKALQIRPQSENVLEWRARSYLNLGQYKQAAADFSALTQLRPSSSDFARDLGLALIQLADWKQADLELSRAIALGAKDGETYANRGAARAALSQHAAAAADFAAAVAAGAKKEAVYGRAITIATRALSSQPSDWRSLLSRGIAYRERGQPNTALEDLTKAAALAPREWNLRWESARIREELKNWQAAADDLSKAIELKPDDFQLFSERGRCLLALSKWDAAAHDFTRATELRADNSESWTGLASTSANLKRWTAAIAQYTKAIDLAGMNEQSWRGRGDVYLELRDWASAESDFDRALKLEPDRPDAASGRAIARAGLGRIDDAISDFDLAVSRHGDTAEIYAKALRLYGEALKQHADDWRMHLAQGVVLERKHDYDGALSEFAGSLKLHPADWLARFHMGLCNQNKGLWDDAVTCHTEGIGIDPKQWKLWLERGFCYRRQKHYASAVADMTKAIELNPANTVIWYNRGLANLDQGGADQQAFDDFSKAISLNRDDTDLWVSRARTQMHLSKFEGAVADYTRALELDSRLFAAWSGRADAYKSLHQSKLAAADLERATNIDPNASEAWISLAAFYVELGSSTKAISAYTSAIKLAPEDWALLMKRGRVYYSLERWQQAVADFTETLKINSYNLDANRSRGEAYSRMERWKSALTDFQTVTSRQPNDAEAWLHRGLCHFNMSEYPAAIDSYSTALKLAPASYEALGYRGETFRLAGKFRESVADLDRALELRPQNTFYLRARGASHLALKEYEPAIADLTKALQLEPNVLFALTRRAEAYQSAGKIDLAIADATAILAFSNKADSWKRRALAYCSKGEWKQARADFQQACRLSPDTAENWEKVALTQLAEGDRNAYRLTCATMIERFGRGEDRKAAALAVRTALLFPNELLDKAAIRSAARLIVEKEAKNATFAETLGAALYRNDELTAAHQTLDLASDLSSGKPTYWALYFMAMTQHRLGDKHVAQELARRADQQVTADDRTIWEDRVRAKALRAEVEQLFAGPLSKPSLPGKSAVGGSVSKAP